jgi:hypothetical protein
MAGNRFSSDSHKQSSASFWKNTSTSSSLSLSSSLSSTQAVVNKNDDMDDEFLASFAKVSVSDTLRAVLVDANSNVNDLCELFNSSQISDYRNNAFKEADYIAERVEKDLDRINELHGETKVLAEEQQRLEVVQVVQAYIRCLELDIVKWKEKLKLAGKSESDIAAVNITIRDFVKWENRSATAPAYTQQKLQVPVGNTIADQIGFVQLALNYWRSCYQRIREYEHLIGVEPYAIEKELWRLEQTAVSYLDATGAGSFSSDINRCRLREPNNINPTTGQPLSIAAIQELIQQHQEQSGYKNSVSSS